MLAPSLKFGDMFGLFVFGGRDDESIHKCGQWPAEEVEDLEEGSDEVYESVLNTVKNKPFCKPEGLRYHTMCRINNSCIIVHGGENFKSRNNISSRTLFCVNRKGVAQWFSLEGGKMGARAGHGMAIVNRDIYIVGGGDGKTIKANLLKLEFFDD